MISSITSSAKSEDVMNDFIEKKVKLVRNIINTNNFGNSTNQNGSQNSASNNNALDENSNNSNNSSSSIVGGRREIDAADTLVSLANTPTVESKPFLICSGGSSTNNIEIVNFYLLLYF